MLPPRRSPAHSTARPLGPVGIGLSRRAPLLRSRSTARSGRPWLTPPLPVTITASPKAPPPPASSVAMAPVKENAATACQDTALPAAAAPGSRSWARTRRLAVQAAGHRHDLAVDHLEGQDRAAWQVAPGTSTARRRRSSPRGRCRTQTRPSTGSRTAFPTRPARPAPGRFASGTTGRGSLVSWRPGSGSVGSTCTAPSRMVRCRGRTPPRPIRGRRPGPRRTLSSPHSPVRHGHGRRLAGDVVGPAAPVEKGRRRWQPTWRADKKARPGLCCAKGRLRLQCRSRLAGRHGPAARTWGRPRSAGRERLPLRPGAKSREPNP